MPRKVLYLAFAAIVIGVLIAGCASTPGTTPTPTPTTTVPGTTTAPPTTTPTITTTTSPPGNNTVVINLQAKNIAFNKTTITVPAGATVLVHFYNDDAGIYHNFAVYTNSAATTPIFKGQLIQGVSMITYTFTAPSTPGNYWFRCDVHPTIMYGTFTVT